MTPEAQRIAIALACGYMGCTDPKCDYRKAQHLHDAAGRVCFPEPYSTSRYPDYVEDLNAMNEAEKLLNQKQQIRYVGLLQGSLWTVPELNGFYLMHKSAAQRAEAFLRTLGLWEESPPPHP